MESRKIVCMTAALLVGGSLTMGATHAGAGPTRTVVVEGKRIDPSLQRRVSFADLNLAAKADQRTLKSRIVRTAGRLCFDLNGYDYRPDCQKDAVHSTDAQFAAAVVRAERELAGLPSGPGVAISIMIGTR